MRLHERGDGWASHRSEAGQGVPISTQGESRAPTSTAAEDGTAPSLAVLRAAAERSREATMVSASTRDDPAIRIRFVNDAFVALTGYPADELIGASPGLFVGPDTDLEALRRIEAQLADAGSVNQVLTLCRRDGSSFRADAAYHRFNENGTTWFVATYRDLTDRAEADNALWRSEEWAQGITRNVSDLIVVTDERGVVTWASPSVTVRLGYELDDVIGREVVDLLAPEQVAFGQAEWAKVASNRYGPSPTTFRVRHRDGSVRTLSVNATNQLEHPAIRGVVLTGTDISERAEAEERLQRSEQWARALVQRGADLVAVIGGDGAVRYASPAVESMLGYTADEFCGLAHLDLVHPDDRPAAVAAFRGELEPGAERGNELRVRHRDGSYRILDVVITDLHDDPAVEGVVMNARDVTGRRLVEHLLSEQAELLEAIARGAPLEITLQKISQMVEHVVDDARCAIGMLDPDGVIRVRAAPNVPRRVVGFLDDIPPADREAQKLRTSSGDAVEWDFLAEPRFDPDGLFTGHGFVACRTAPVLAPGTGELLGSLSVFRTSSRPLSDLEVDLLDRSVNLAAIAIERRRFESTLEYQALYDALTGLPNRSLLLSRIEDALHRAARLDTGVAVLFIDLDRFKVINDSIGHASGDELLLQVTERFKGPLRPGDTLGRFGGDEFVVVCSRIANEHAAAAAADRFLDELRAPFVLEDGGEVFVTASVGIAFADEPDAVAEALIRNADVAMYRAKDQGRNQLVVFQANLDQQAVERLALEQALRAAIDEGQFELHFQPVVDLTDGAMTHVEALIRWHRPGHGLVFPGVFIPLAEETGLVVRMGWWVLEDACRRAAEWPDLPNGRQVEVAVNLAARQLASPDLMPVVSDVLARTGLPAHRLCFEVTESALVHDVAQAKDALNELKSLGVRIAIDDFGTGYASLDYVRHFSMADYLKIDRSFVEGVEREGSNEAAIVKAAIALARSLGLTVIAEGVETLYQMEALRDLECDLAQGYLFSKPVPVDAAIELLASQVA